MASAQMKMNMVRMENSAGYMSSGTSVEPLTTSETAAMIHKSWDGWTFMFHANADLVSVQQSGPRGRDKVFAPNWIMPMLGKSFGRQSLEFRTMLSAEPLTVTKRRYPELFQNGETAYGLPVIDGQHPHDLFMELGVRYEVNFAEKTRLFVYGAPVGEPALGPTAFPHRASNSENPLSMLGHHVEDSTHISNSVVTVGFIQGPLQLEASTFHGQEPNENRWNIDRGKPDSFASRISFSPDKHFSGQFSIGRINNREALHSSEDTLRMTASIHHHASFSGGHIATSVIWGRNKDLPGDEQPRIFNAYDLETTVKFRSKNWVWGRVENLDRDQTLLVGETPAVLDTEETPIGRIQAWTLGYEREIPSPISFLSLGIGTQYTGYRIPAVFKSVYGERPSTAVVFLRLRPVANMADHIKMMHQSADVPPRTSRSQ